MSESSPEQLSNPESFTDLRNSALEWVSQLARDTELDQQVVMRQGGKPWQKLKDKYVYGVPPEQYEAALAQWRQLYQHKLDSDPVVREKNLFLAFVANEVEEESSADGVYLRALLTSLNKSAQLAEDTEATRRAQFMGLWVARRLDTDISS